MHRPAADYWQCAYLIEKVHGNALERSGLPAFRDDIPQPRADPRRFRVDQIRSWDDIKLLTVVVDRLETWWLPGLLCIGDAAHAMSPVGGSGSTSPSRMPSPRANQLARPLRRGSRHAR